MVGFGLFFGVEVGVISDENSHSEEESVLPGKALIVDDDETSRFLMQMTLESVDLELDVAHDGVEAIEMFKSNSYDVIMMDEVMPSMDGLEATKIISKIEERRAKTYPDHITLCKQFRGE